MNTAERVLHRWVEATTQVTKEYVQQLKDVAQRDPSTFWSSPRILNRLFLDLDLGMVDPFPVSELSAYLLDRGVDEDEAKALLKVKPKRAPKTLSFSDALQAVEKAAGASVIFEGRLQHEPWAPQAMMQWAKAFKKLKAAAKKAAARYVKKVKLHAPRGSEDASWQRGVLALALKPSLLDVSVLATFLTHELGHAVEEGVHLDPFAPPWGKPPFISDYAESRPNVEDFAESFRSYVLEPSHLKRVAPEKYEALRRLVK